MERLWILKDGELVPAASEEWGAWFETADRTVAKTKVGEATVSTVFLAVNHSFGGGPPVLWETLVFGGPIDGEMDRYTSRELADVGHLAMVERVKEAQ